MLLALSSPARALAVLVAWALSRDACRRACRRWTVSRSLGSSVGAAARAARAGRPAPRGAAAREARSRSSPTRRGAPGEHRRSAAALAEVKALELGRARQWTRPRTSLRRLEAVVAGSATRGAAGENILARVALPAPAGPARDEPAVRQQGRRVRAAPAGRPLPPDRQQVDGRAGARGASPDASSRRAAEARGAGRARPARRIREVAQYLDPERTHRPRAAGGARRALRRVAGGARRRVPRGRPGRAVLAGAAVRARALSPRRCASAAPSTRDQLAERLRAARRGPRALGGRGRVAPVARAGAARERARRAARRELRAGPRRAGRRPASTTTASEARGGRGRARRSPRAIDRTA